MHGCLFGAPFGWGGWWINGVLGLAVLGVAAFLIARFAGRKGKDGDRRDSLEILKQRLAKGEITLEEFTNIKNVL